MIPHLSSEQLSEFMLGQPSPLVARHVRDCATCQSELANFREALGEFRGAVRAWSQHQANAAAISSTVEESHPWTPSRQLAWALLMAAVCIIASFVLPRHGADGVAGGDAVLLNQVDTQVSRTVPSSMEPLLKLVVQE